MLEFLAKLICEASLRSEALREIFPNCPSDPLDGPDCFKHIRGPVAECDLNACHNFCIISGVNSVAFNISFDSCCKRHVKPIFYMTNQNSLFKVQFSPIKRFYLSRSGNLSLMSFRLDSSSFNLSTAQHFFIRLYSG